MTGTLGALAVADARPAIVEPGQGSLSYAALDRLAGRIADRLAALGVERGMRIGLFLPRGADAIAAMLGILRAGCSYVPVDPRAPIDRIAHVHADCRVHASFVGLADADRYRAAMAAAGHESVTVLPIGPPACGGALDAWVNGAAPTLRIAADRDRWRDDLACILYTSGTTGQPKGWMMSRVAVEAHASWCHRVLAPTRDDVFANHAQFNFGMSLFDIYSSLGCGAPLVIVPEAARLHGRFAADLLAQERIGIWFSGPAILSLIGAVPDLETRDLSALRIVAFAGEVFPLPPLNVLRRRVPHPRYFNFYGSTETNVALYYELPASLELEARPPIGRACEHYEARVVDQAGVRAPVGATGELQLRGAGLASGYWSDADGSQKFAPADDGGEPWFKSSDMIRVLADDTLLFAGRIGRMVKVRGYRVEPGEIEARLYQHDAIAEAGVVPSEGPGGTELVAHLSTRDGERLPVVQLKEFCAVKLPAYMIPSRFEFHASLPRTSTGKIDLQRLRQEKRAEAAR